MSEDKIIQQIATDQHIRPNQVAAALRLFADGNTVPFIARYRKEATGVLDEVQLRNIQAQYEYEQALEARKETIRQSLMDQGLWSNTLRQQLLAARQLQDVEDIYLPYRPKKRTKASVARAAGLEPLADLFWKQDPQAPAPEEAARPYVSQAVPTTEDAIQGAANIIAERCSELAPFRRYLRQSFRQDGKILCTLQVEEANAGPFLSYKEFSEHVRTLPSHRILAINRGEAQKILKVSLQVPAEAYIKRLQELILHGPSPYSQILADAAADSYKRLIGPQIEREVRNALTEKAERQAIRVFAANLRSLLLQPPFAGQTILGLDPGFRTGCKAAVIDATGKVLDYGAYYLTGSEKQKKEGTAALTAMIRKHGVTLISIGNGTASYETEQVISQLIADQKLRCRYIIANEAGASVYSASDLAREEMPDLDVTIRGAVSIARRIQDPLAEAVKIDPQSIGVGQYQHDVNQKALNAALDAVVESVVNYVGVDLNTASAALLQHISGLTAATAGNIVAYRREKGPFKNRQELLAVNRLGPATFTQCAGFLRIAGGTEPLDNTSVHPESYELAGQIIEHYGYCEDDIRDPQLLQELQNRLQMNAAPGLAAELGTSEQAIRDILEELRKTGRDARSEFPQPLTRQHVVSLDELQAGSLVQGTVQNVVDFGAFVDFGLKIPGLVHRSELSTHPFHHPMDIVHVGDIVTCVILSVDAPRKRIALSMKRVQQHKR